jgi:hypothetical protein
MPISRVLCRPPTCRRPRRRRYRNRRRLHFGFDLDFDSARGHCIGGVLLLSSLSLPELSDKMREGAGRAG